jgi:intracellular septation protein A
MDLYFENVWNKLNCCFLSNVDFFFWIVFFFLDLDADDIDDEVEVDMNVFGTIGDALVLIFKSELLLELSEGAGE